MKVMSTRAMAILSVQHLRLAAQQTHFCGSCPATFFQAITHVQQAMDQLQQML